MPQTNTFDSFLQRADYSLIDSLNADPEATDNGHDHQPREVLSGHYVPVNPTPLPNHEYIAHSSDLFEGAPQNDNEKRLHVLAPPAPVQRKDTLV